MMRTDALARPPESRQAARHDGRAEVGVARRKLGFWQRFAVALVKPASMLLTRRDWHGWEHIPAEGVVILAVNHISHADPFFTAHYVFDSGRWPQLLGKESVFRL